MTDRTLPPLPPFTMLTYEPNGSGRKYTDEDMRRYALTALAPLEAENAALRASLVKVNAQAEEFERKWYLSCGEVEDLQARVAELESATGELLDCMFHDGVPVDPEHPKRVAVEAAHAALLASSPDQSVDANKMGGADCAGGGEEG